jgi:hypothetical protein
MPKDSVVTKLVMSWTFLFRSVYAFWELSWRTEMHKVKIKRTESGAELTLFCFALKAI